MGDPSSEGSRHTDMMMSALFAKCELSMMSYALGFPVRETPSTSFSSVILRGCTLMYRW
jgi:hypothetical protein